MKKFIFLLIVSTFLTILPFPIEAQGTYYCREVAYMCDPMIPGSIVNNCEEGYGVPDSDDVNVVCGADHYPDDFWDHCDENLMFTCVSLTSPTPSPSKTPTNTPTQEPTPTPPSGCIYRGNNCPSSHPSSCYQLDNIHLCCETASTCEDVEIPNSSSTVQDSEYDPCRGIEGGAASACRTCINSRGSYTALGCIPNDPSQFAGSFIRVLFGIAGGIAFLLMIYGAFLCITSQGNPQKSQACRETITSAIVGLLLLIFSLFIIQVLFRNTGGLFPDILPPGAFQ